MTAALVRLTNAVGQVSTRINEVAQAIKDHPANEDGALNGMAATLEAGAAELAEVANSVNQPGQPESQPAEQPPVENLPSGDPTGAAEAGGEGAPTTGDQPSS